MSSYGPRREKTCLRGFAEQHRRRPACAFAQSDQQFIYANFQILYIYAQVSYSVHLFTGFIFCTFTHRFHILYIYANFHILYVDAQISYFEHLCTYFLFGTFMHIFHSLYVYAQISYVVHLCTCFIFCTLMYRGSVVLSGRELYTRQRCHGFEPYRCHSVVSLSKTHLS